MSPPTPTLGTYIKSRRVDLIISQAEAARRARVKRQVWIDWETDKFTPRDTSRIKIDDALQWARGSADAILHGGEPSPLATATEAGAPGPLPPDDEFVRYVRGKKGMSDAWKKTIIEEYWADKERDDARRVEKYSRIVNAAEA